MENHILNPLGCLPSGGVLAVGPRQSNRKVGASAHTDDSPTESPTDLGATGINVTDPGHQCDLCEFSCKSKAGLSLHQRSAHAEAYHARNVKAPSRNKKWTDEDVRLLAKAEVELLQSGKKVSAALLHRMDVLPGRTEESLRGQRKTSRHKSAVSEVQAEFEGLASGLRNNGTHDQPGPTPSEVEEPVLVEEPHVWQEALREAIVSANLLTIDMTEVTPGAPTINNQRLVDQDLTSWLPPIPRVDRPPRRTKQLPRNKRH